MALRDLMCEVSVDYAGHEPPNNLSAVVQSRLPSCPGVLWSSWMLGFAVVVEDVASWLLQLMFLT